MNLEDLSIGIVVRLRNAKRVEQDILSFKDRLQAEANKGVILNVGANTEEAMEKIEPIYAIFKEMENGMTLQFRADVGGAQGLADALKDAAGNIDKINKKGKDRGVGLSFKEWNSSFKSLTRTVGKFVGALFITRGIWFALRRSMTLYLQQNTELKNKLDGLYYGIGSMFAPLLESMLNIVIKLVSYIDVFVKALGFAGLNMANFNKNAQEAKKALLGIDEITNLSDSSSSSYTNPFADVQLNENVVSGLKRLAEGLLDIKLISNILNGNKLTTTDWTNLLLVGLGATAIGFTISALTGNGTALTFTLGGIATCVIALSTLVNNADTLTGDDWLKILAGGLGVLITGIALIYTGNYVSGISLSLTGLITIGWSIKNISKGDISASHTALADFEASAMSKVFGDDYEETRNKLNQGYTYSEAAGMMVPNYVIDQMEKSMMDPEEYRKTHYTTLNTNAKYGKGEIASFDNGTSVYVPNDQLAYVHKGEAISPKKFNSNEFFGETSAEELNLLASINDQLEQLNNKDYTINLDGENVATKINNSIQSINKRNGYRVFEVAR